MQIFKTSKENIRFGIGRVIAVLSPIYEWKNVIIISAALIIASGFFLYKALTTKKVLTQQEYIAQNTTTPETIKPQVSKVFIDATPQDSFSTIQINSLSRYLYGIYPSPPAQYSVKKYKVRYSSLDSNNKKITIVAQFYIPEVEAAQSFPIYVFGQGTTGLGDQCAVSLEQPRVDNWGDYQTHMLSYASQGYIVMFPDYEGFNDPTRIHHYFNAEMEAHVLLDGAKASFEFLNVDDSLMVKPKDAVFFAGYSQGGHAAFAVSDYAASYAPELPIKGVIGDGPTNDISNLLKENPILTPYLVYAYADLYGKDEIDPAQILQPNLLDGLANVVTTVCIGKIGHYYSSDPKKIFNDKFYQALFNNTLDKDFPEIKKLFDENSTGTKKSEIPALILQGTTDPIVTLKSEKDFMLKSCNAGNRISYFEYPGVHHYQTRQVSVNDTLNWMKQIVDGTTTKDYCASL